MLQETAQKLMKSVEKLRVKLSEKKPEFLVIWVEATTWCLIV